MRPFPVRLPSGTRYWTVIDDDLRPVPVADAYLRHVRFGRDDAESTTKSYAGAVALYLTWCVVAHLDWWLAADRLGSFSLWLRHTPSMAVGRARGWCWPVLVPMRCVSRGLHHPRPRPDTPTTGQPRDTNPVVSPTTA